MYAITTTTHGHVAYWSEWGGWAGWSDWKYQANLYATEGEAEAAVKSIGLGAHATVTAI